jgi:cellulose synthase/poly-beta-1,6-N-acetylglucosamine synthase-like glycosyltransferase
MRGELRTAGYKALDRSVGRVVGGMTAAAGLSLLTLALGAFAFRESPVCVGRKPRLAVLVPAHNEADLVERCVASLRNQDYPPDRFQILVIAHNRSDDTRVLAQAAGAEVLVREAPEARGKGLALLR